MILHCGCISLAPYLWDKGKQFRPTADVVECSGLGLHYMLTECSN